MAEKRRLEPVGAVSYSKHPRLEVEAGHVLSSGLCRSSTLPGYSSENHYSYKGSYFAYPLQCHEGPKSLSPWTPTETYAHCTGAVVSHPPRTDKALCMLYRPEAEGFGARGQISGHEKAGSKCMAAQEKPANYMGHTGLVQQGWVHGYPAQHSPRTAAGFSTLAVPKPVYRNHSYCAETGYGPKASLALGMQVESMSKQPAGAEWALPPSGHLVHMERPGCGTAVPPKPVVSESGYLPSHQGSKDTPMSPVGFSPFRKVFEKCQATYHSPPNIPEARGGSPRKHARSKLPPAASPLANPQNLTYQERSPACYPLTSYALTSHEQMLLYHQSYVQAEKANSLFSLPACKGFDSPGREDPQLLPGPYLTPRSYYPSHLDSYIYRSLAPPPPATPPSHQPFREHEPQPNARTKADLAHEAPISSCTLSEKASYCGSFSSRDGLPDCHEGDHVGKLSNENFPSQWATPERQPSEMRHPADRLPGFLSGFRSMQEAACRAGLSHSEEEANAKGEELCDAPRRSTLTPEAKKRNFWACKAESGKCIVISDSPVASHDSCLKGDSLQNILGDSGSSFQSMLQPSEDKGRGAKRPEEPLPSSSPPMPVINNVFSLAPYQRFLADSESVDSESLSKSCQTQETSLGNSGKCMEVQSPPRPDPVRSGEVSGALLPGRKETACDVMAKVVKREASSNSAGVARGSEDYAGTWESCRHKRLPPSGPAPSHQAPPACINGSAGPREDHALDLSFKTEGLAEGPGLQRSPGKMEAVERESSESKGKEASETLPKRQEIVQEANVQTAELAGKSGPAGKSSFHSSSAFLYKKFKIQKSHAAGRGCAVQQDSSSLQLSSHVFVKARDVSLREGSGQATDLQGKPPVQQSLPQAATQQNTPPVQQSLPQAVTRQNTPPVQQSLPQAATQQNTPPVQQSLQQGVTQPKTQLMPRNCFSVKLLGASKAPPPSAPAASPALGETHALLSTSSELPRQHFTALHTSICAIISCSVSTSAPELLKEWLEKTKSKGDRQEKAAGLAKHKNGSKFSEAPMPSKGKEIWLAFKDMALFLNKLLSQLEAILFTRKCPFPHVIRAGTIFIPIHVVKETLFPNLSSSSVDHVLQDHRVELRPTTLSEERLLRDLELKSCTSRMLKLLALKQLPDIYPDLLNLHWHDCVKQQLGDLAEESPKINTGALSPDGLKSTDATRCLQGMSAQSLTQHFARKHKQGKKYRLASCLSSKTRRKIDDDMSQGASLPSIRRDAALKGAKLQPEKDSTSVALRTKGLPLHSKAAERLLPALKLPGALKVKLADSDARKTASTSKGLHHRQKSMVRIKFQNALRDIQGPPAHTAAGKKRGKPSSLLLKRFRRRAAGGTRASPLPPQYPELVGKRIRHLYEEKDKTEAWYPGVVLRIHKRHKNPLKTVYEVRYDSEPEWQYYLEILQDYKKGWLEVDE
ncbi:uncharacterized protein C15orf39 homolog isoform X1 [Zootoca vivipara]|uniref:uncharacterized protein C15orf39 homolog isoform X1 n=1 Tax=Zootoca vivipara TaxID=8524 RepID=UPI00293B9E2C|nr:uncharacterized protein C15orf39 homolog isoform X1 [Zootoca vivipara]XP_060138970.1 uncharacterized protein C15orf39 homolog isoform X1 [Zootoca vivipara]